MLYAGSRLSLEAHAEGSFLCYAAIVFASRRWCDHPLKKDGQTLPRPGWALPGSRPWGVEELQADLPDTCRQTDWAVFALAMLALAAAF